MLGELEKDDLDYVSQISSDINLQLYKKKSCIEKCNLISANFPFKCEETTGKCVIFHLTVPVSEKSGNP